MTFGYDLVACTTRLSQRNNTLTLPVLFGESYLLVLKNLCVYVYYRKGEDATARFTEFLRPTSILLANLNNKLKNSHFDTHDTNPTATRQAF